MFFGFVGRSLKVPQSGRNYLGSIWGVKQCCYDCGSRLFPGRSFASLLKSIFETRCSCAIKTMQSSGPFVLSSDSTIKVEKIEYKKRRKRYSAFQQVGCRSDVKIILGVGFNMFQWFHLLRSQHCLGHTALAYCISRTVFRCNVSHFNQFFRHDFTQFPR